MHLTQMSPLAFRPVSQFVPLPTLAHKGDGQKTFRCRGTIAHRTIEPAPLVCLTVLLSHSLHL